MSHESLPPPAPSAMGIQLLLVFCLSYPPLNAEPRGIPIGVAGFRRNTGIEA